MDKPQVTMKGVGGRERPGEGEGTENSPCTGEGTRGTAKRSRRTEVKWVLRMEEVLTSKRGIAAVKIKVFPRRTQRKRVSKREESREKRWKVCKDNSLGFGFKGTSLGKWARLMSQKARGKETLKKSSAKRLTEGHGTSREGLFDGSQTLEGVIGHEENQRTEARFIKG